MPYSIRGLLKEFEYLGVGICCSGNIIQQFSSSHKLVLAIFGTLELHEFLFPVIVRHQTLGWGQHELMVLSWARIWIIVWARSYKLLMMTEIKMRCLLSQRRLFTVNINWEAGADSSHLQCTQYSISRNIKLSQSGVYKNPDTWREILEGWMALLMLVESFSAFQQN